MQSAAAIIAANRFGLGAQAGEVAAIEADPRGWLLRRIEGPAGMPEAPRGLFRA